MKKAVYKEYGVFGNVLSNLLDHIIPAIVLLDLPVDVKMELTSEYRTGRSGRLQ